MTRPKVPDDKRIRTAAACDSCKRRKQKCNGLNPCQTCSKRTFPCVYSVGPNGSRRTPTTPIHVEVGHGGPGSGPGSAWASSPSERRRSTNTVNTVASPDEPAAKRHKPGAGDGLAHSSSAQHVIAYNPPPYPNRNQTHGLPTPGFPPPINTSGHNGRERYRHLSTTSGPDEVAEVLTQTRMLQDPRGRLLYLGDSATLSCLQYLRMIVESVAGPSPFTEDPNRHRLLEVELKPCADSHAAGVLLPDRATTDILVASYFTYTNSLVEVFDRDIFAQQIDLCYNNPIAAQPGFHCLLHLVLAIGLLMATPIPGSDAEMRLKKLHGGQEDRADQFFMTARRLGDPMSGFEDADFWSVQALLLMSVYTLTQTRRNAAYAYHGMAVRTAFSLGLHKLDTMVIFPPRERAERRNVWRSLYVLDRFLAAALGRPVCIPEEDCAIDALKSPDTFNKITDTDAPSRGGLEASVRSCQVIGIILKKVYAAGRKISTKLAHDIADECKGGPQKHNSTLHWRQNLDKRIGPAHGMVVLHVNLLYCHAVILLTRPFFMFSMNRLRQEDNGVPHSTMRSGSGMEKFSGACVDASYHTITLVHRALENGYLPQRDPFVIHFLFAAALVVLSSEFALLHRNDTYAETVQKALSTMGYCAKSDPQAKRLLHILNTFNDIIVNRASMEPTPAPFFSDLALSPNTPTGSMDDIFLCLCSSCSTAPTSVPTSATFTPLNAQPMASPFGRGDNAGGPSSQSPGLTAGMTPDNSAAGELMNDPQEWHFDFDDLWQPWPPSGATGTGPSGATGSNAGVLATDPAMLSNENSFPNFDGFGDGGIKPLPLPPTPGFAPAESMSDVADVVGAPFNNNNLGMPQVPPSLPTTLFQNTDERSM